ncbi:MAG: hypothetical protein GC203_00655 [Phenylobacterium sp.]|uniref:hypothetical protein n=1 Tax=Phenylobacterium sp. TaxID=1871053 RepID=UPI0025E214B3|nr:hypothetical protein [Phenylobacterium sp.]MBI1196353.1 hypothetical protein [Phenylobacterium sp.]
MIRILTAAAVAALIAAPASAESVRISTVGKSTEQLHADIAKAAKKVCVHATTNATFPHEELAACMKATVAEAVAQTGDPELAAAAGIKLAQR